MANRRNKRSTKRSTPSERRGGFIGGKHYSEPPPGYARSTYMPWIYVRTEKRPTPEWAIEAARSSCDTRLQDPSAALGRQGVPDDLIDRHLRRRPTSMQTGEAFSTRQGEWTVTTSCTGGRVATLAMQRGGRR